MKRLIAVLIGFLILCAPCVAAIAVPFGDGGVALQTMLDNITTSPIAGESSVDVWMDATPDSLDSAWNVSASGGFIATVVGELSHWSSSNRFGVYDVADPSSKVQLFDGSATGGSMAWLSMRLDGSVFVNSVDTGVDFPGYTFGYYLDSRGGDPGWTGGIWYSDTRLNVDGQDHMAAYQGKDVDEVQMPGYWPGKWTHHEYVLAFEDLHAMHWGNHNAVNEGYPEWSDTEPDYADFVVIVQSAQPIPEPTTLMLLGLGGFASLRRRRRQAKV